MASNFETLSALKIANIKVSACRSFARCCAAVVANYLRLLPCNDGNISISADITFFPSKLPTFQCCNFCYL